jgi:hypothetical protein
MKKKKLPNFWNHKMEKENPREPDSSKAKGLKTCTDLSHDIQQVSWGQNQKH